jgi:flavin-dependent dehydrogenase
MRMGQMAAKQAAESIEKQDFSAAFLKNYDKAVRSRMKSDFLIGTMIRLSMLHLQLLMCRVFFSRMVRSCILFFKS